MGMKTVQMYKRTDKLSIHRYTILVMPLSNQKSIRQQWRVQNCADTDRNHQLMFTSEKNGNMWSQWLWLWYYVCVFVKLLTWRFYSQFPNAKNRKLQWAVVLCWWEKSEENSHNGWNWLKVNSYSYNHSYHSWSSHPIEVDDLTVQW